MGLMPKFKKGHTESHASKKNLIIRSSDTIYAYKMSHSLPAARHRITTQQTKAVNHKIAQFSISFYLCKPYPYSAAKYRKLYHAHDFL